MSAPACNTVAWFQVGTADAEQAKRFYGDLFGWRYTLDPNSEGKYHLVSYPGADTPSGGIVDTGGEFPNHAIFIVMVQDVAAVCAQVERPGGKVLAPPATSKDGLVFADLHDPAATTSASSPRRPRRRPAAPQAPNRSPTRGVPAPAGTGVRGTHEISGAETRWRGSCLAMAAGRSLRTVRYWQPKPTAAVVTNYNLEMNAIRRSARLAAPRGSRVEASRSGRSGPPDRGVRGAAS
jgi:uncharacterized protein